MTLVYYLSRAKQNVVFSILLPHQDFLLSVVPVSVQSLQKRNELMCLMFAAQTVRKFSI